MSMMTLGAILAVGLLGFIVIWLTGTRGQDGRMGDGTWKWLDEDHLGGGNSEIFWHFSPRFFGGDDPI